MFKDLSPVEYLKISKVVEWKKYKSGQSLIVQGIVDDLILIYNGTVNVIVDGEGVQI